MQFNDLLKSKNFDPRTVLVLRHRPVEPELRKRLPWLAAEKPDVYNAFQQAQWPKVEKAMTQAKYVASFIGHEGGRALFVGLYQVSKWRSISSREFWNIPANIELKLLGMTGMAQDRAATLWFDLPLVDFYLSWKGKLIVRWPPPERSWWRWAHRNEIGIQAILEDSALDPEMKSWDEIALSWADLSILPSKLRAALAHWRGIYFIFDISDGKAYVGSAYGDENLLHRWRNYAKTGHGGNIQLRQRNPDNFRFSILQRVSPDMPADEVIQLENSWKNRLHTRASEGGLNDN